MNANQKTRARIDLLNYLESATQVAGRKKDPVVKFVAAEMEIELKTRREALEKELANSEMAATGTEG